MGIDKLKVGDIFKKVEYVADSVGGCRKCGQREIYVYIEVLEKLDNVVCVLEYGQIKWVKIKELLGIDKV